MEKLVRGIHTFQSEYFRDKEILLERLTGGQNPQVLFISCSDSRVVPDLITQAEPGDLFTIRNAGNIIPVYDADHPTGESATIEYAVNCLKIRDIIVCGHSHCGAMHGLMNPDGLASLPHVQGWLRHAERTRRIVETTYQCRSSEATWQTTAEENVLVQLENLRTHPSASAAIERGALKLHAWMYKIETGEVFSYDPRSQQYLPLTSMTLSRIMCSTVEVLDRRAVSLQPPIAMPAPTGQ